MSILICQPIFGPVDRVTERNINSIISLGKYLKDHRVANVEVCFGGWCADKHQWEKILNTIKDHFGKKEILSFKDNVGKAVVVNTLTKKFLKPYHKYIISADSDILFSQDNDELFQRLIVMANRVEEIKGKPFGLIGLQQQGHGCHYKTCYENSNDYTTVINGKTFSEKVVWPNQPSGIAGGCIFVSRRAWEAIGGYRVMGVYAGDDAYFLMDLGQRGFTWQMADSIPIIHPPENDEEYAKWKVKVCQRDSGVNRQNIKEQIKEASDFWKNRR
jgi:hypothetical protein